MIIKDTPFSKKKVLNFSLFCNEAKPDWQP